MIRYTHRSGANITSAIYLVLMVVFPLLLQNTHAAPKTEADIRRFANGLQVDEEMVRKAFNSLDTVTNFEQQQNFNSSRKLGSSCESFRMVTELLTHYRPPITCEFSPDDTSPQAQFSRYLDDEFIPFLELVRSLGFTYLAEKTDACFPPTYVADLLKDLVFSLSSPCYRLQKSKSLDLSRSGSIIDLLLKGVRRLNKIPVVGKWFRIFSVPLGRVSKMWKEKIEEPANRKCNKMNDDTRDFIEKLDSYITKYQIYMDRFINVVSYYRVFLCGFRNPDRISNRMLRVLESQKNISIATGMEQHRFLAFNPELVDLTPLHDIEEIMSEITVIMSDFGQTFNIFVESVDNAFDDVNAILDQSVLPKVMPELSKVANIVNKISSKLKFLQCPVKGFFGFICNLDSLIADMVNKILKEIGIDIDDMIGDIVESILNPILKIPDLTELIPNFDFLGNVLNVDDTLLRPIKEKLDQIGEKLEGFDFFGDSISYTGVPDLELDVIGAIEYLYSKGNLNSAKLECVESETFPYTLSVIQRNKCGINDVTRFFGLPCGFDSTCDMDMSSFVNDLPSCPSQGLISDIGVESSDILYICITKDQFENFAGMPAQHLQYLDEEEYECPSDFHEKLYIGDLQGRRDSGVLKFCPVAKLDTCLVPIRDVTDLSSNINVAFHVGVTISRTFNFHFNPVYVYGNCFLSSGGSQQFSRDPSLDKLVMECPANHIIRIDEVAHDVTIYSASYSDDNEISQRFLSSDSADENFFSTSNAKDLCNNKNNCEFSADDLFEYKDIGMAIVTYRASYECLELCPAGHALLPTDSGSCIPCGAGFYRDDSMSTCTPCATGTFNINETASICRSCPIGSFNSIKGHIECTVCEPGYVTTDEGSSSSYDCIPCEAGEFSTADGLCTKCPPGTTSTTGSFDCFDVPPGSFNNGTGVQVCPPGSFTDEEGAIECNPCEEGSYTRDFNSDECAFCNIGTYQDKKGESSCKVCPNGKVTKNFGALSEDECQPAPTPIQYSSVEMNGSKCEDVLSFDLVSNPNHTEEEKAVILQQRLMQVGDGICNNGPWNTMQCDFDGGDCCPQTCVVPNNVTEPHVETTIDEDGIEIYVVPNLSIIPDIKYISEQSCKQSTFSCLDPKYAGEPTTVTCPISNSPSPGDSSMCELDLSNINARKGDGLCDSCLNTEEHDFDGGDCCPQTCEVNPAFVDSCLHYCECKQTHLIDTTPPQLFFEKKPDIEITVPVTSIPETPLVFATDNVPNDFDPTIQFIETRGKILCSNMYTLLRKWTAIDGAGNPTTATSTIHVADFFPPIISNTDSIGAVTCLMAKKMKFNPSNITFPFMTIKQAMLELDHIEDDCGSSGVEYCDTTVNPVLMGCEKISSLDTSREVEEESTCNIDYNDLITLQLDYVCKEAIRKGGNDSKRGNNSEKSVKSMKSVKSKKDKKCKATRAMTHHFDIIIGFDDECGNTSVGNLTRKIMVVWPSKEGTTPPDICNSVFYFNEEGKLQVD